MTLGSFGFIYLLTGLEGRKVFFSSLSIVNMVFDFLRNGTSKSVKSKVHVQTTLLVNSALVPFLGALKWIHL